MNGINLNIATGWTAATLATQRKSWVDIKRLSQAIQEQAYASNWEQLFELAERRDCLIAAFFTQSICKPLVPTIIQELEEIKAEHSKTMQSILVQLERNSARQSLLTEHKAEVKEVISSYS